MVAILYSIGKDVGGNLIVANQAVKGSIYYCLDCNGPMIVRKGEKKRPHFAHKGLSDNCSPESALHRGFKELLYERLTSTISQKTEVNITWKCNFCSEMHLNNLIRKTTEVRKEFSQFYKDNKFAVVIFKLTSDEDIHLVSLGILNPTEVSVCTNPKCKNCGGPTTRKSLYKIVGSCWKCEFPMKIAIVVSNFGHYSVDGFNRDEVHFSLEHGVNIQRRYSSTTKSSYLAHVCNKCNSFIGNHFLFDDYIVQALYNNIPFDKFDMGFMCSEC